MILGIGFDAVEIGRIAAIKRQHTLEKLFTEEERRQAGGRAAVLAGDFAVKEAVAKALGTGFRGFLPGDIEALRDALGKPYVRLFRGAAERLRALGGGSIHVSISDTDTMAYASAVIEQADNAGYIADNAGYIMEKIQNNCDTRLTDETLMHLIPARRADANKGSYGKLLIAAGCSGMSGAAFLAAMAAYRSGTGLVKLLTHADNRVILQTLLPEAIIETYTDEQLLQAEQTHTVSELVRRNLEWADGCILGPGIGTQAVSHALVRQVLCGIAGAGEAAPFAASEHEAHGCGQRQVGGETGGMKDKCASVRTEAEYFNIDTQKQNRHVPVRAQVERQNLGSSGIPEFLILDADALNLCARDASLMRLADGAAARVCTIITPHPMEMSRLCGQPLETVLAHPRETAERFAQAHGTVTVLKGMPTWVSAEAETKNIETSTEPHLIEYCCDHSSPALAKAGSGDVLTGCIAGMYLLLRCEQTYEASSAHTCAAGASQAELSDDTTDIQRFTGTVAAALGVLVHNTAGRCAASACGEHSVLARETADAIGQALKLLTASKEQE